MEKERSNLDIIQMSCRILAVAIDELLVVNEQKTDKREAELINLHPFSFYRVSLQYMIVMELCKLLEPDTKDNPNKKKNWEKFEAENPASISKISRIIFELRGNSYQNDHKTNVKTLDEIRKSVFYKNLKIERDKKLGHSDANYSGNPYSVKTFNETEIREVKKILGEINVVFKRGTNSYADYEYYLQHEDGRTRNFIDYHIVYKEHYDNNLMKDVSEGYTINHKRNGLMPRRK